MLNRPFTKSNLDAKDSKSIKIYIKMYKIGGIKFYGLKFVKKSKQI